MSIEKDQKYLRVRNTSSQNLYLADLDNEENKQENKGVQVYIPSGEHADLPLDDDVLHSYEQGTIRGFIDQGLMTASPFGEQQDNTLWVSPEGDNSDPGTFSSPLSSIQTAIDQLDSQLSVGADKKVKLKQGRYVENITVNTANLTIESEREFIDTAKDNPLLDHGRGVEIAPKDTSKPVLTVTNMTKNSLDQFYQDGGVSRDFTAPDSFSYTGATLGGRDAREDLPRFNEQIKIDFTIRDVMLFADNSTTPGCALGISVPDSSYDEAQLDGVSFKNIAMISLNSYATYMKNLRHVSFVKCRIDDGTYDTCTFLNFADKGTKPSNFEDFNQEPYDIIVHGDDSISSSDGGVGEFTDINYGPIGRSGAGDFYGIDVHPFQPGSRDLKHNELKAGDGHTIGITPSNVDLGDPKARYTIRGDTYEGRGSNTQYVETLRCVSGTYSGSGTLDVNELKCVDGNFTISSGASHVIRGGYVEGNLTINGGTDVELRGLTIAGDVIVDQDNTSVALEGCHVEGVLDVDSDNINVTVSGGTIMSANDPGSNITTESAFYG